MERRQNDWSDVEKDDGKSSGNIGLPFGLCEKYGIKLPENATPRVAWDMLKEKRGIEPPWTDDGAKQWTDGKPTVQQKEPPQTKQTAYDVIENKEGRYKIHGELITAKPYSLIESWISVSKRGYGYYFGIDVGGKKYFVSIDSKTANDRRWVEPSILGYKNMKVSANGYIYVDTKGYANFVIKDLNNFSKI
jgi:hypothetical protein|nr:MAG TPA: hypothetical protein [Caudoviricetes sp.]